MQKLHGRSCALLLAALTGALAGCTGDTTAQSPASAVITGSISPVRYELTPEERAWDCPRLTEAIEQALPDLARLTEGAAAELQAPPASLTRAVARAIGEPAEGYPQRVQLTRARNRLESINAALGSHGCQPVDIDARVATLKTERTPAAAFDWETATGLDRSIDRPSVEPADLRL